MVSLKLNFCFIFENNYKGSGGSSYSESHQYGSQGGSSSGSYNQGGQNQGGSFEQQGLTNTKNLNDSTELS